MWVAAPGAYSQTETGFSALEDQDSTITNDPPGLIPAPAGTPDTTPAPDSLFIPVVPGSSPTPAPTPILRPASPVAPTVFEPADIPAPTIRSTPETVDIFDEEETTFTTTRPTTPIRPAAAVGPTVIVEDDEEIVSAPRPTPTPAPKRTYQSTSTRRTSTATATTPRPVRRETPVNQALTGERLAQAMAKARANRDADLAQQIGWANFNRKDYPSAALWFEQSIAWDTDLGASYYGLALTKFNQGNLSQAEAIAGYRVNSFPKMRTLLGDILVKRATEEYEDKQYARTIDALDRASKFRTLGRNEQIIRGWSYYYLRDYNSSANIFQDLYRIQQDRASAEGLYAALTRLKEFDRLAEVAAMCPGPLTEILDTYQTNAYEKAGLYYAAYEANPRNNPALVNIDSPSVAVGFEYAQKSGQSGESKLQTSRTPVIEGRFSPAPRVIVTAKAALLMLQSGSRTNGAFVGTPPLEFTRFQRNVSTGYNDLFEAKVRVEYQDFLTPYIEIGTTPLNADLDPRPVGRVGAEYRYSTGYIKGEFYSQSIRESVLSYVGQEDPYVDGREWGRVQETGGSIELFQGFLTNYTAFFKASYGEITGTNTKRNNHLSLVGSLSYVFKPRGFEYISIGPAVSYERFDNNQNFFTYGHGGYFSPDSIIQGIIEAQFLTKEGRNYLISGSVGAGAQQNKQSDADVLPLDPDGRVYEGTDSTTGIFLARAEAGVLLTPYFMLGTKLSYAVTADYDEGFASIYGRIFFEPRAGLFRSDLGFSYW